SKLPTFEQFFSATNWIYLGTTMAVVKVLHEFGHGLSCKRYGGECHEMGFMFLVFTPCLYCNVSDSWMLPNKWNRVFIGAAGMYVELILASIATYLWWFSDPSSMFNFLCLSVMFICSVSTVVFNGNPLLRFDGYYIVMDMLEIPNLRQKATDILKRWFQQYCLGLELQENPFLPQKKQFFFALFTICSVIYRWVVVFSIMMFLMKVLEPYGLEAVGRTVAVVGLAGMIFQPLWQIVKFFRTPGRASKMKRKNVLTSLAVVTGFIVVFCFVPLPFHIECAVEIQPQAAAHVFTVEPGRLVSIQKRPGEKVESNEVIAVLHSDDLNYQLEKELGELFIARTKYETALTQGTSDSQARAQLKAYEESVLSQTAIVKKIQERMALLSIRSPIAGTIMPVPDKEVPPQMEASEQLPSWSGNPFDNVNSEAVFTESDEICMIGDPNEMEAVLVIDQHDIDLVQKLIEEKTDVGVDMKLESSRMSTITGYISDIAPREMTETSEALASQAGGSLNTEMGPDGRLRPISTSYQALVPLKDVEIPLRPGYRGHGKIYVGWKSAGWRVYRFLAKTFRFDL
ncbi:MAG: hemolysin D, partial [Planctomycetota bacterium]